MYYGLLSLAAKVPAAGYDADAQAFFTAAGITDTTQKSAVNQLVLDLKSYSIWTKMKAIYPFVGGTSTTHSYNLKDTTQHQITWYGGVTHNSNGITGNNTNAYGDTGININTGISNKNSVHCSIYQRNNIAEGKTQVGACAGNGGDGLAIFSRYSPGNEYYGSAYTQPNVLGVISTTDSRGFYLATRTTSTAAKQYKILSGVTQSATNTNSSTSGVNGNFHILSNGFYSVFQYSGANLAFTTIGDGMNDSETANLNSAVLAFQTTLGRNV